VNIPTTTELAQDLCNRLPLSLNPVISQGGIVFLRASACIQRFTSAERERPAFDPFVRVRFLEQGKGGGGMDPFGNFGWDFGFGFGWILIGITVILMALGIAQLVRYSFRDEREKSEEQEMFNALKQDICSGKMSIEEFEKKVKTRA
jgi:hypothetical protein